MQIHIAIHHLPYNGFTVDHSCVRIDLVDEEGPDGRWVGRYQLLGLTSSFAQEIRAYVRSLVLLLLCLFQPELLTK
jgi:hypothetical protein